MVTAAVKEPMGLPQVPTVVAPVGPVGNLDHVDRGNLQLGPLTGGRSDRIPS